MADHDGEHRDDPRLNPVARGMVAGAVGGLVLTAGDPVERVLLGRTPVYAPHRILSRLLAGHAHFRRRTGVAASASMRCAYAMSLGAAYGAARRGLPRAPVLAGVALGAAIWAFEIVAMPSAGATPRLRAWSPGELVLLGVHTLGFGLASAIAYEQLGRHSSSAPASAVPS